MREARGRRVLQRARTPNASPEARRRAAQRPLAGLLWAKKHYRYDVAPVVAKAIRRTRRHPRAANTGATSTGGHLYNGRDINLDAPTSGSTRGTRRGNLAFHMVALSLVDRGLRQGTSCCCSTQRVVHASERSSYRAYGVGVRRREPARARVAAWGAVFKIR